MIGGHSGRGAWHLGLLTALAAGCSASGGTGGGSAGSGAAGAGGAAASSGSAGSTAAGSGGGSGAEAGGSAGTGTGGTGAGGAGTGGAAAGGAGGAATGGTGGAATGGTAAGGTGAGGAGATGSYIEVVLPTDGQVHVQLPGSPPLADVDFAVTASPDIVRVEYRIETDFLLGEGTTPPSFPLSYQYQYTGDRWVIATGFDAAGNAVASDQGNFVVAPPVATGCLQEIAALGVDYTETTAKGVVDAVNVNDAINGVLFASGTSTSPTGDPLACEFVKTLWAFADLLKEKGFVRVGTLGSYCYRCCCSWSTTNYCRGPSDPEPDCSANGYSNHSWGRAVDVRYLYKADGTRYDINDPTHWVIGSSSSTCTTGLAGQSGISRELYDLACQASARRVFGVTLTPNYNAAHRNHFHMDIGSSGTPTSWSTRDASWVIDVGEHHDHCGGE